MNLSIAEMKEYAEKAYQRIPMKLELYADTITQSLP